MAVTEEKKTFTEALRNLQNASLTPRKVAAARKAAVELALQAEWKNFFTYYREAYTIALKKAAARHT